MRAQQLLALILDSRKPQMMTVTVVSKITEFGQNPAKEFTCTL